jgi:signal transduction histidine kinase
MLWLRKRYLTLAQSNTAQTMARYKLKVLLIDDSDIDLKILEAVLRKTESFSDYYSFEIDCCRSFSKALPQIKERRHDLYFVDYLLEGNVGLDLIEAGRHAGNDGPYIVLTGHDNKNYFDQSLTAGSYDFILKGEMTPSRLSRAISAALERQRQERIQTQEKQEQKMQALGQMASGMAHEVNNLLQPILFRAESLMAADLDEKQKKNAGVIQQCTLKAADIINDVLAFSRTDNGDDVLQSLPQLCTSIFEFSSTVIPKSVILKWQGFEGHAQDMAHVNSSDMTRIFMNLFTNASQAMNLSGRIDIQYSHMKLAAVRRKFPNLEASQYQTGLFACIQITDSGPGISANYINKIFHPFFTTKEVGSGTGLGLSIVYSILQDWGGVIDANNGPEGGACFTLYIPVQMD